jgi:hypothetical protein
LKGTDSSAASADVLKGTASSAESADVLKGHGFSRAANARMIIVGFSP